jgi:hypothetical protein
MSCHTDLWNDQYESVFTAKPVTNSLFTIHINKFIFLFCDISLAKFVARRLTFRETNMGSNTQKKICGEAERRYIGKHLEYKNRPAFVTIHLSCVSC